ncbi:hypothetical protein [Bradyrhizobium lablabi]|uniref:hypothetical protein n=1 Tax=Bradyrhizobium lablabi TaxID=722472 RepID=UPI001BA95206|nr:hypothetical protein [Bradyrhizobium lablabi]MBR0693448.1 hypothetical protein [Bradyrhizobium lablabi]
MEFFRPFKQATLAVGLIVGRCFWIGNAIDCVRRHFPSPAFLVFTRLPAGELTASRANDSVEAKSETGEGTGH